jgi:hypothetical protein
MSKIDLETKIESLKTMITEGQQQTSNYAGQLDKLNKELKDYNKPELTGSQLDDVYAAIEEATEDFDFNDSGNYNIEYGIDYDGRVHCESLELSSHCELNEKIAKAVCDLFKEVPSNEEGKADNS